MTDQMKKSDCWLYQKQETTQGVSLLALSATTRAVVCYSVITCCKHNTRHDLQHKSSQDKNSLLCYQCSESDLGLIKKSVAPEVILLTPSRSKKLEYCLH